MRYLLMRVRPDIIMNDVATAAIDYYFRLYAASIRLANRVGQRNMPAAHGNNFTDQFAQPPRSANNERGRISEFPRRHLGCNAGQICLSRGLGPRMRIEGPRPTAARNSQLHQAKARVALDYSKMQAVMIGLARRRGDKGQPAVN